MCRMGYIPVGRVGIVQSSRHWLAFLALWFFLAVECVGVELM